MGKTITTNKDYILLLKAKTPCKKFLEAQVVTPIQPEVTLNTWEKRLRYFLETPQLTIEEKSNKMSQMSCNITFLNRLQFT